MDAAAILQTPGAPTEQMQTADLDLKLPSTTSTEIRVDDTTEIDLDDDLLIVSPYLTLPHQLRLSTLDVVSRLVTLALTKMDAVTPEYATTPYAEAFNWNELFSINLSALVKQQHDMLEPTWPNGTTKSYYVVQFRSTLKEDADRDLLGLLDQKSHEEATTSGGLLKYWFGSPNANRQNLATCIWRCEQDAIEGGKGPWHKQARQSARVLYDRISFARLWLNLTREGDEIVWSFEDA